MGRFVDRPPIADPWARYRAATPARIGLGRSGDALPTAALLDLQMAHARARDAVHGTVDFAALAVALAPLQTVLVRSAARDRAEYLARPDLGRRLESDAVLSPAPCDICFVVADGLSAAAVATHAAPLVHAARARLGDLNIGPVVLAEQGRVAIGDDVGARLGARLVAVLIGERPGLSVADSLGVYLTFDPKPGRRDSERNCISNIHGAGLGIEAAADKLAGLARGALALGLTGVGLKEDGAGGPLGAD
jgi:ethanolamine ammonia-lyase small subunit